MTDVGETKGLCLQLPDGVKLSVSLSSGDPVAEHLRGCMSHDPCEREDGINVCANGVSLSITLNSQHPAHAMWMKALADVGLVPNEAR